MSVNKFQPHILVLPEDEANERIAIGFEAVVSTKQSRRFQVLPPAGGWTDVLEAFRKTHSAEMSKYANRRMVLLLDFDRNDKRLDEARTAIPEHLAERVTVLGVWSEPEDLPRAGLGTPEQVGSRLAEDCRDDSTTTWDHELLKHNAGELNRMTHILKPILFP